MMTPASPSNTAPTNTSFRLIVEYNGSRFHGFQSQSSSNRNDKDQKKSSKAAASSSSRHCQRISKRPRYDSQGHVIVEDEKFNHNKNNGTTVTIQDCLQDAIVHWSGQTNVESLNLRYCSRTDKGVHAKGQVVVITLTKLPTIMEQHSLTQLGDTENDNNPSSFDFLRHMRKSINSRLPWDISISSIAVCPNTFHPRHDVVLKQYSYTIKYHRKRLQKAMATTTSTAKQEGEASTTTDTTATTTLVAVDGVSSSAGGGGGVHTLRSALEDGPCLWLCPWPLEDAQMMVDVCKRLQGYHDYTPFWHKEVRKQPSLRKRQDLKRFTVEILQEQYETGDAIITAKFMLRSKSFQRSQCRNLVGLVVDICRGHVPISVLDQIFQDNDDDINSHNNEQHVETMASFISSAPASGLCLDRVWYHDDDDTFTITTTDEA